MGSLQSDKEGATQKTDIQIIKSAQSLVRTEDEHSLADNFENSTQVRRLSEPAGPCQIRAAQEDEQTLDCDGEACGSEPCDAADKESKQERKKQPGYNKK